MHTTHPFSSHASLYRSTLGWSKEANNRISRSDASRCRSDCLASRIFFSTYNFFSTCQARAQQVKLVRPEEGGQRGKDVL